MTTFKIISFPILASMIIIVGVFIIDAMLVTMF
jgi:hypothetical protein